MPEFGALEDSDRTRRRVARDEHRRSGGRRCGSWCRPDAHVCSACAWRNGSDRNRRRVVSRVEAVLHTQHLMAGVSTAVCWGVFGVTWDEVCPNSRGWGGPPPLAERLRRRLTPVYDGFPYELSTDLRKQCRGCAGSRAYSRAASPQSSARSCLLRLLPYCSPSPTRGLSQRRCERGSAASNDDGDRLRQTAGGHGELDHEGLSPANDAHRNSPCSPADRVALVSDDQRGRQSARGA